MLSIKDFSEMCHLTPQALRFYHAEGLIVPAHVDDRTGFRSYEFEQVEQVMLVTLLRDAGLTVKQVRLALDEPDRVPALLDRHQAEVLQERAAQDDAIQAARSVFSAQPEVIRRQVPLRTVISKQVHGTPPGHSLQEWTETGSVIEAAATELLTAVEAAGRTVLGRPWQTLAPGSGKDAVWLVEVAIDTPFGKLPDDLPGELRDAGEEVSIFVPGRATMAKYCTALLRLMNALPLDGEVIVDIGRIRQEVRRDGVLLAAPLIIPADPESQYRDEQPAA